MRPCDAGAGRQAGTPRAAAPMTDHACSLRPVTHRCQMLEIETPVLLEGRAVSDGSKSSGHATNPPPRVFMVARTERSPGFGTPLAFPVSQWLESGGPGDCRQVTRYSGGAAPVLHRLPSSPVRVVSV